MVSLGDEKASQSVARTISRKRLTAGFSQTSRSFLTGTQATSRPFRGCPRPRHHRVLQAAAVAGYGGRILDPATGCLITSGGRHGSARTVAPASRWCIRPRSGGRMAPGSRLLWVRSAATASASNSCSLCRLRFSQPGFAKQLATWRIDAPSTTPGGDYRAASAGTLLGEVLDLSSAPSASQTGAAGCSPAQRVGRGDRGRGRTLADPG